MEQQTWVTLLGLAGFALARTTNPSAMRRDLKTEITGLRAELRAEMRDSFGGVSARQVTLERTYDLSTRMPPAPMKRWGS